MSNPIGWCDRTWNPITGCTKISPACDHCYAERMSHRLAGRFGYPADDPFRVTFHPDKLDEPLHWRKSQRVFVCSMGDLFHEDVPDEQIAQVWQIMARWRRAPHTFLVLTKRPERMRQWVTGCASWEGYVTHNGTPPAGAYDGTGIIVGYASRVPESERNRIRPVRVPAWPLENVWLGVTAEDQQRADERIPILLSTPAAKRFVSVEPMLGPVDLGLGKWIRLPHEVRGDWPYGHNSKAEAGPYRADVNPHGALSVWTHCEIDGVTYDTGLLGVKPGEFEPLPSLDWIICGPENGPGKRPMDLNSARSLRDQAKGGGVPFWYKGGLLDGVEHRERPT